MSRPLRLEYAGALYHVTSRGDRREDIYLDDKDRLRFLELLEDVCDLYNWECHAYCLMSNHYHLLIETPDANLSKGMRQLNGVYTQDFNRLHSRVGHVFQGRYKAIHVEKQIYLLELARYIVLNPVRAEMVRAAKDWPWSSYRATAGQVTKPSCLSTDWLLASFAKTKHVAMRRYREFVAAGKGQPPPWGALRNQVFLGSEHFIESLDELADGNTQLSEIPSSQRRGVPKPLDVYAQQCSGRRQAMSNAYLSGGYSMKEIADYFEVHYSTVSREIKREKKQSTKIRDIKNCKTR